jgi:DNA-binding transcriptional MerR regulator/methylmalonyl-CoA mutase cobalamin-binding subunit
MAQYSIKDLEKVTGIKAHTIRIWEKRYGIVEPSRSTTNIRSYSDADLRKLLNISLLNRNGIKISRLAGMSYDELVETVRDLEKKPGDGDAELNIESLLMAMIDLDEQRFSNDLNKVIERFGFEECLTKVIRPFLAKAGVLWMTGTINPAQEHFVSNLIRNRLISEIDHISPERSTDPKRFLLFLPEGELHELGLLFMLYLIKKNGHDSIYFGQSTPVESVIQASAQWHPDYILLSLVSAISDFAKKDLLGKLASSLPDKQILISGYQTQFLDKHEFGSIKLVNDYDDFMAYL